MTEIDAKTEAPKSPRPDISESNYDDEYDDILPEEVEEVPVSRFEIELV